MIVPNPRDAVALRSISHDRLILVEGGTDANFFEALAQFLGLERDIEIRDYRGKDNLRPFLRALVASSGFHDVRSVLVTRDADDDPAATRQSVEQAVADANIPASVNCRILIMPDDTNAGMLETLCLASVEDSPVLECVAGFFECLESKSLGIAKTAVRAKHEAQVFLATLPKVQLCPGIAAQKGIWPLDNACFEDLRQALKSM